MHICVRNRSLTQKLCTLMGYDDSSLSTTLAATEESRYDPFLALEFSRVSKG